MRTLDQITRGQTDEARRKERRYRIYDIPPETILFGLAGRTVELPEFVCLEKLDVPEGARVLDVHWNYERRAFAFIVEHESFEPVLDGCEAPRQFGGKPSVWRIALQPNENT